MKKYDKFLKDNKMYENYDELDSQTENKYKDFFVRVMKFLKANLLLINK